MHTRSTKSRPMKRPRALQLCRSVDALNPRTRSVSQQKTVSMLTTENLPNDGDQNGDVTAIAMPHCTQLATLVTLSLVFGRGVPAD